MLTIGSLFAGIGGLELGLEWSGLGHTIWQVEIDDFCNKRLERLWPDVKRYGDIKNVGKHNLESANLICAGWPCQPFSIAGKRRGKEDDRYLWPEVERILKELKPAWFVGENVPGIIRMGIDETLSDLENLGYSTATFSIPACAVDAWHIRQRIFIVAYSQCGRHIHRQAKKLPTERGKSTQCNTESTSEDVADTTGEGLSESKEKGQQVPILHAQRGSANVADPLSIIKGRYGIRWPSRFSWWEREPAEIIQNAGERRGEENGLPEPEPELGRVAYGIPNRVDRLKCLGNAVVPQITEMIGKFIMEFEKQQGMDE